MPTRLSVNINKVALIRNSRAGDYPNLLRYAQRCIAAGAHGITIHPRPDQRHIRASDAPLLKKQLEEELKVELNIEGNPFAGPLASQRSDVDDYPGFMPLVLAVKPSQCTLVPDTQTQLTSDHGFDLKHDGKRLQPIIEQLHAAGIRCSLFMDPDCEQISLARELGADHIELYTGPYAAAFQNGRIDEAVAKRYQRAGEHALSIGLKLNAGHDLNLDNLTYFKQLLPALSEVSIGHALTVDALQYGIEETLRRYLHCLRSDPQ